MYISIVGSYNANSLSSPKDEYKKIKEELSEMKQKMVDLELTYGKFVQMYTCLALC